MGSARRATVVVTVAVAAGVFLTAVPNPTSTAAVAPSVPASRPARVVKEAVITGRLRELTIDSPAMGRLAHARVLLPTGFRSHPRRTWPVLYLLHGCCDVQPAGYRTWSTQTDLVRFTARSKMIIVMPEGGFAGFYSDWVDRGPMGGPGYETFHLTELRRILETRYRANKIRAIAGLSMGGFGALSYAARHPGMFRFAASYSGAVDTQFNGIVGPSVVLGVVSAGAEGLPTGLWGDPVRDKATWSAHNPAALIPRLLRIPMFVSSGNGMAGPLDPGLGVGLDPLEAVIGQMNVSFVHQLKAAGARVTVDLYGPGTHTWPYWQREFHRSYRLIEASLS